MSRGVSIIRELKKKYVAKIEKDAVEKKKLIRKEYDEAIADFVEKLKDFVKELSSDTIQVTDSMIGYYKGSNTIYISYKLKGYDDAISKVEEEKRKIIEKLDEWEIEALKALAKKEDIPEFSF